LECGPSGCVTSAETVLISQQSSEELGRVFQQGRIHGHPLKAAAFIVSPQSLAALAVHFNIPTMSEAFRCLQGFLGSWAKHEASITGVEPLGVSTRGSASTSHELDCSDLSPAAGGSNLWSLVYICIIQVYLYDLSLGEDISLAESATEFVER